MAKYPDVMRKRFTVLVLVVFLGSVTVIPSFAASKSGSTCKSLGSKRIVADKEFTCIKSGKKLVWNKGTAIAKQTPKSSPNSIGTTSTPTPSTSPNLTPAPTTSASPTPTPVTTPVATEPCVPLPPRTYPTVIPSLTVTSDKARYVNVTIDVATPTNMNRNLMIARLKCQKIENVSLNVWFKSKYDVINGLFTSRDWVADTFGFSIIDAQGELQLPYSYRLEIPVPEDFLGGAGKIRADFTTSLKQITGYNSGPYSNFVEFIP